MKFLRLGASGAVAFVAFSLITFEARIASAQDAGQPAPTAYAAQPAVEPPWPRVGGHWGFALPIVNVSNVSTTVIGRDFANIGIAPGVTVKLDPHWAIDFEF